jgi:hypothetical protein
MRKKIAFGAGMDESDYLIAEQNSQEIMRKLTPTR